jgi:hypothetical protein
MKPIVSSLALAAMFGMAPAAGAQQAARGDAAGVDYCRTLARTYLGQNPVQSSPNVADATLADGCSSDTQATTAILKHKLADHGIDRPKAPTVASGDGAGHPVQ